MVFIYHFINSPLCMFVCTLHCIRFASLIYRYLYILFTDIILLIVKYASCTGAYFPVFPGVSCGICKKVRWKPKVLLHLSNVSQWNLCQ